MQITDKFYPPTLRPTLGTKELKKNARHNCICSFCTAVAAVEWYPPPSDRFLRVTSPMNSELEKRMGTNQEKLLVPTQQRLERFCIDRNA